MDGTGVGGAVLQRLANNPLLQRLNEEFEEKKANEAVVGEDGEELLPSMLPPPCFAPGAKVEYYSPSYNLYVIAFVTRVNVRHATFDL